MKNNANAHSGDWTALDAYLRESSTMPVFTEEDVSALGTRAANGEVSAQEQLVKGHLRLVVKIAHQYSGYGLPLADIVSEGNIGLIRAAELYDPKFGTKFSTYASVWIKQRIHRAITKQARAVRIPVWRSQRLRKLTRLNEELSTQLGRPATEDELADRLGLTPEQMAGLQADRFEVVSIDAPCVPGESDSSSLLDSLPDENVDSPSEQMSREELSSELMTCLHELEDRELEILSLKHGLLPKGEVSFRELGRRLGVSHEWVRRMAEFAAVKVRRSFERLPALSKSERDHRRTIVLQRLQALGAAWAAGVAV